MTNDGQYEGATAGRVLILDESATIPFPEEFREARGTGVGLMVLVYKDKQVKIYPIQTDEVIFLSIEIGKLTNDFLTKLSQVFRTAGLVDLMFSTGVCLRGTRCFYECYFAPEQLAVETEELKNSLRSLDGVKTVIVKPVSR